MEWEGRVELYPLTLALEDVSPVLTFLLFKGLLIAMGDSGSEE